MDLYVIAGAIAAIGAFIWWKNKQDTQATVNAAAASTPATSAPGAAQQGAGAAAILSSASSFVSPLTAHVFG